MNLINTACYNCNTVDSNFYDYENGYTYVKCIKCGLIYLNPRPAHDEILKANEYGVHKGETDFDITGTYNSKKVSKYLKILADFYRKEELQMNKKKWLDIGCGFGEFIEALEQYSNSKLTLLGSEPNMKKIISCKKRNLAVDFFDLDDIHEKYNYISLLNVYSHLPNPVKYLTKIKESLAPEGELLLETGHSCHLPAKFHHKPYYAPDHLSFASREIVENILERIGFHILKTKIYRHPQFIYISSFKSFLYYSYELLIKKIHWKDLFPRYPKRDMFIRAKMIQ
jgi:SAM-dependent methyltransferase